MNENFFKFAMDKLAGLTVDELGDKLREFGFKATGKMNVINVDSNNAQADGNPMPMKDYERKFKREYRLYSFVNHYLHGIQAGIQTGHAAVDLVMAYSGHAGVPTPEELMVMDWAENHKTFIILNGGLHVQMLDVLNQLKGLNFPYIEFHESKEALNGVMTAIAVVLPDEIFNLRKKKDWKGDPFYTWVRVLDEKSQIIYSVNEKDDPLLFTFIETLKSKRLAS